MMDTTYVNRSMEMVAEEDRLIRQAKSGDANAFARLYDICVEHVYRYIYFQVANDIVAENITVRVFFKAWEQLDHYQAFGSSFILWLYTIARNQVISYYHTHKKIVDQDDRFVLPAESRYQAKETQDMFDLQAMRDSLQFLTEEEQQILILKFIVGLPAKDIAHMLAKHESDILVLQARALQTLAHYLKEKALI